MGLSHPGTVKLGGTIEVFSDQDNSGEKAGRPHPATLQDAS
jgi:hypothetical protein